MHLCVQLAGFLPWTARALAKLGTNFNVRCVVACTLSHPQPTPFMLLNFRTWNYVVHSHTALGSAQHPSPFASRWPLLKHKQNNQFQVLLLIRKVTIGIDAKSLDDFAPLFPLLRIMELSIIQFQFYETQKVSKDFFQCCNFSVPITFRKQSNCRLFNVNDIFSYDTAIRIFV